MRSRRNRPIRPSPAYEGYEEARRESPLYGAVKYLAAI
jgi:hypothetical protein